MPQTPLERLTKALAGRYEIEREVGEGGMATVYVADDLKHRRRVALKVLKPELSAVVGAERFLAEIETTANLQHPHILPLFDSGEADGLLFYVMPYVEGETLRERLQREKQLPIDEAVRIATAVAGALDYAHRHGVVHRDIKPANILVHEGQPVVSDFGIALAVGAGGARLTETGLSVGSPYYMSPEQATGDQAVGPASDIYSLACVVYEMLVGEPPFLGATAQAVLGKIIQGGPVSATAARKSVPPHLDAAVRKALEKLPADRFPTAQDFARALADQSFRHGDGTSLGAGAASPVWRRAALGFAGTSVALLAALLWAVLGRGSGPPAPVERFASPFLQDQEPDPNETNVGQFALARDGSFLAYRSGARLWIRRWGEMESTQVRGTAAGFTPTLSPAGDEVAVYLDNREIRVVPLSGGPGRTVLTGVLPWPHWGRDGFVYARVNGPRTPVVRVAAAGGPVDTVWTPPQGVVDYVAGILPNHRRALVMAVPADPNAFPEIQLVDVESGERTTLTSGERPRYLAPGYLAFVAADSSLMVAPFDAGRGALTGPAVSMVAGVGAFDVADDGSLYYATADPTRQRFALVWADMDGRATPVQEGWTFDPDFDNRGWRLSPDGTKIAVKIRTDLGSDIWVKELPDGPLTRLTFDEGAERMPRWSPDGSSVTFLSPRSGDWGVWSRRADGVGDAVPVYSHAGQDVFDAVWTPDGSRLVMRIGGVTGVSGGRDLFTFRPGVDTATVPLLASEYDETGPAFSPDGRWLAYVSDETGQREVFVRPFPDVNSAKVQISDGGGRNPVWAPDGRALYYITNGPTLGAGRDVMVAELRPGPPMAVLRRRALFTAPDNFYFANNTTTLEITPDGKRFLIGRQATEDVPDRRRFVLVKNWLQEVREKVR